MCFAILWDKIKSSLLLNKKLPFGSFKNWGERIRTSEMAGPKPAALPLGDAPTDINIIYNKAVLSRVMFFNYINYSIYKVVSHLFDVFLSCQTVYNYICHIHCRTYIPECCLVYIMELHVSCLADFTA